MLQVYDESGSVNEDTVGTLEEIPAQYTARL